MRVRAARLRAAPPYACFRLLHLSVWLRAAGWSCAVVVGITGSMDRYTKVEKGQSHGEGAYGVVYKGKDRVTGDFVAMKVRAWSPSI